jgi:hypothetical protein
MCYFFWLRVDANRTAPGGSEYRHPGASDRSQPAGINSASVTYFCKFPALQNVSLFSFIPKVVLILKK